jgi:hypothetical protein
LAYANVYDIIAGSLHGLLDGMQARLKQMGYAIREDFFRMGLLSSRNKKPGE